jgi:CRP-like cAMP-binding protein
VSRFVPEGEVLFEAQSIGYEFFVILKGMVSICIGVKGQDHDDRKKQVVDSPKLAFPVRKVARFKSQFKGVPKSPANPFSTVVRNAEGYHVFHGDVLMKQINTLRDGASLGEAAIMGKDTCTRNATIFCKTDCYYAVLDKTNFQRIIGEHTQRDVTSKVQFLKRSTLFSCLPDRSLATLIYFLEPHTFKFRDVVLEQGEQMNKIIIIKSGRVKVATDDPAGAHRRPGPAESRHQLSE